MIVLRPGVEEILNYRGGYLAVPAVPGAGKTTTLAHLAANLIAEKSHRRGRILIVTYMNSSVGNFKKKVADCLIEKGLPENRGYEVKTLHSLAVTILKERPDEILVDENLRVLEPVQKNRLIHCLVREWVIKNYDIWEKAINFTGKENSQKKKNWLKNWFDRTKVLISDLISYFKCNSYSAQYLRGFLEQLAPDSFLRWTIEIYVQYQDKLREEAKQDFDDLLLNALFLLEKEESLCARLRARWPFIFEDEAQDSNPIQEKILLKIAGEKGNLVRVGDSNQAIMGTFTVAEPELFRAFCRREDVEIKPLVYSSRSSLDIINLANHLVHWTSREYTEPRCREALEPMKIKPVPEGDPYPNPVPERNNIFFRSKESADDELRLVAHNAARFIKKYPQKTCAILVTHAFAQDKIEQILSTDGTPYRLVSGDFKKGKETVEALGRVIDYLAYPHRNDKLISALSAVLWSELENEELDDLRDFLLNYPLEELLYPLEGSLRWSGIDEKIKKHCQWNQLVKCLERVKKWLDASRLPPESLILFLAADFELVEEELAVAQRVAQQVKEEMRANPGWRLPDLAVELLSPGNVFDYFNRFIYERKGFSPQAGIVDVSTYHKAKGLEWDAVFMTYLTVHEFPSLLTDSIRDEMYFLHPESANPLALARAELKMLHGGTQKDPFTAAKIAVISERLRLFYVGITRAKEVLVLSRHQKWGSNLQKPALSYQVLSKFAEGQQSGRK